LLLFSVINNWLNNKLINYMFMNKVLRILTSILLISVLMTNIPAFSQTIAKQKTWTEGKANKWLKSMAWANGLNLAVHKSVNKVEFAKQYSKNKAYWDEAFAYLRDTQLDSVAPGKYYLDDENVYVLVTEGKTKAFEDAQWEAHKKYIDIQYVIQGKEKMGIAPFSKASVKIPFNETTDIGFYDVPDADGKFYVAEPGTFLIFFPQDAHRPAIQVEGFKVVKKVVIKIKAD
jgi:biofilm protein TabA